MRKLWPIYVRYYPYSVYRWLSIHYQYYKYEDTYAGIGDFEHELWLGKLCFTFGKFI